MSEEFCTSERKRASLVLAAASAESLKFSRTAKYWRASTAAVRRIAPTTMPPSDPVWRSRADTKSVPYPTITAR